MVVGSNDVKTFHWHHANLQKQVQQDSNQTNIFRERLKKKTVTLRFKLQTTYWNCIEYLHTRTVKNKIYFQGPYHDI